jgi:quercetin dioxygenase-like cupin family protein
MEANAELLEINSRIPQAEKERDVSYLDTIVDETLVFKRADGTIVGKSAYLSSVKNEANTVESIDQVVSGIEFNEDGSVAIINAIVKFNGTRSGKMVQGIFRNTRYFRNEKGWKMFLWHNDKLSAALHCVYLDEENSDYARNNSNEMNGVVYQEKSSSSPVSPDMRATKVRFENGGHTKWHFHEGWQVLIGDEGVGFVEEKDGAIIDLSMHKRVLIPPFVWHRHGARRGETMTHMAVTIGKTTWDFENRFEEQAEVALL